MCHTVRTRESQRSSATILEGYKHAVRVALADGFVTREEVQELQALRHQLDITRADHERIMAELMTEVAFQDAARTSLEVQSRWAAPPDDR